MRRIIVISASTILAVLAIAAGVVLYLAHDEDFLKSQLHSLALNSTGRELTVNGPLEVDLGRVTQIEARDIHFSNASWADGADMVSVGRLTVRLDLPSLLSRTPRVELIDIEDCRVVLEESADGKKNWEVMPTQTEPVAAPEQPPAEPPLVLMQLRIANCSLSHAAPKRAQPLDIFIARADMELEAGGHWQSSVEGRIADQPLTVDGWLKPARALLRGEPFEHDLEIHAGDMQLHSSGVVGDLRTGSGTAVKLDLSGTEISRLLDEFMLPPVSSGPFDFHASLESGDTVTRLAVDGDLGTLQLDANGQLDRLFSPRSGEMSVSIKGPNLEALGEVFEVRGLLPEAFSLSGSLAFESGAAQVRSLSLESGGDRVEVQGAIGAPPDYDDTALQIRLNSRDIGQWRPTFGLSRIEFGPLTGSAQVKGTASALVVEASLQAMGSTLKLNGSPGWPGDPVEPDFDISLQTPDLRALARIADLENMPASPARLEGRIQYSKPALRLYAVKLDLGASHAEVDGTLNLSNSLAGSALEVKLDSPNAGELGRLFGEERLPDAPLQLSGHIEHPGQQLQFTNLVADLAGNLVHLNGALNLNGSTQSSDLEVQLQSPNLADLGRLFNVEELPGESLQLTATVRRSGNSLEIRSQQADVGEIRLKLEADIPDIERPLRMNARFDTRLPSLAMLGFLAPGTELPELPFAASGAISTNKNSTQLDTVKLSLGSFEMGLSGEISPDRSFKLQIDANAPDASAFQDLAGFNLPAEAFSLQTGINGTLEAFRVDGLAANLGRSQVTGDFEVRRADRVGFSGSLKSRMLDLSPWILTMKEEESPPPEAEQGKKRWVFGEKRVMHISDLGVDLDVDLGIQRLELPQTAYRDVELGVKLTARRLQIRPFSLMDDVGGHVGGQMVLDGRGDKPTWMLDLVGENIRFGIAAVEGQDISTIAPSDITLRLATAGDTQREMASSLNGKLRFYGGSGQIASSGFELLFTDFFTKLFEALNPFAKSSPYTRIDCSVAAADIKDGIIDLGPMIFNLEKITILSSGAIDLHDEKLDLSFKSKPRTGLGITTGTIINPFLKVGGRLASPSIELNPTGAALSTGAAVATGGITLLARSLADRFLSSKDPCGDARKEIEKRDG